MSFCSKSRRVLEGSKTRTYGVKTFYGPHSSRCLPRRIVTYAFRTSCEFHICKNANGYVLVVSIHERTIAHGPDGNVDAHGMAGALGCHHSAGDVCVVHWRDDGPLARLSG